MDKTLKLLLIVLVTIVIFILTAVIVGVVQGTNQANRDCFPHVCEGINGR